MEELKNIYPEWTRHHNLDGEEMLQLFLHDRAIFGGGDTETTGLHIKRDKAFLIIIGWFFPKENFGRVISFEPREDRNNAFIKISERIKVNVWHNTKYDLHMLRNTGINYNMKNLVENMALARLSVEAIPNRDGGDSLALTDLGKKYVHHEAKYAEELIRDLKKEVRNIKTKVLASALKQFDLVINGEVQLTAKGKPRKWGKGAVEDFLKDITNDFEDLPYEVQEVWKNWHEEYGSDEVTYEEIYKHKPKAMIRYAQDDVITALLFARKAWVVCKKRNQMRTLKRENQVILPLYRMESHGMRVDRDYLLEKEPIVRKYIRKRRLTMYAMAGEIINVGQHEAIKGVFRKKWGIFLQKSDKAALKQVQEEYKGDPAEYAKIILQIRTLEKWYSTYLKRMIDNTNYDGRFYTQIAQTSAVSGRVGSDGQQFPKKALKDHEGNELFYPRRMFIPSGGDYDRVYYLDFSQIELRNQANYTLLVSGGDTNLCRAYMPFKCVHYQTGDAYDYKNIFMRKRWNEKQTGSDLSAWIVPETGEPWQPTDVHSLTARNALLALGYVYDDELETYTYMGEGEPFERFGRVIDKEKFGEVRELGKTFNFMRNYGGGEKAAMRQLDLPKKVASALVEGYSNTFPEVIIYQEAVSHKHSINGYVKNMYDRHYYLANNRIAYKLANYLIQGTCADLLKESIIKIDKYLADKKSRFIMNIHDELQFEIHKDERHIVPELKAIMEDHDWHYVPIIADVEYTETNWAQTLKGVA